MERVRTIGRAQDPEDLINAMRVFHGRPDATDVVSRWQKPLLVINGGHDGLVGVRKAAALARLAPYGQLRVMRAAGHYVNLECPDEFNDALTAVLGHCEEAAGAATPPR